MNCINCTNCGSECQISNVDTPTLFCMNCKPNQAPCLLNCENKAIEVLGGAITINQNKCIKCRKCVSICPIKAIHI